MRGSEEARRRRRLQQACSGGCESHSTLHRRARDTFTQLQVVVFVVSRLNTLICAAREGADHVTLPDVLHVTAEGIKLAPGAFRSPPELCTSRSLPQQRCVLHWRRTFSFTAQWKTKSRNPEEEKELKAPQDRRRPLLELLEQLLHLADC